MKLTKEETQTVAYYDGNSEKWAKNHGMGEEESTFKDQMDTLFKLVPEGKVLEIGSGHGKEAYLLIKQYGVDSYIGVDASIKLLELASFRNPNAKFIHTSIYDLSSIEDSSIEAFWISAMLIHIPKSRLDEALSEVKKKLKSEAYGFISILKGNADMENSRPGRYYSLWEIEEFTEELLNNGFEVVNMKRYPNDSPEGNDWLGFIVKSI